MPVSLPFDPSSSLGQPPTPNRSTEEMQAPENHQSRWQLIPIAMLVLTGLLALFLALAPAESKSIVSEISLFLSIFFSFCCTLWAAYRASPRRVKVAWGLLALGQFLYAAGDLGDVVLTAQGVSASIVTLPDLLQLPFAPLAALGVLLFPAVESTPAKQVRVFLDVLIIVGALLGAAWVFLIAPHDVGDTVEGIVFTIAPITDSILLLVLLVLLGRGVEEAYRPALLSLTIGAFCFIYADTAFNYLSLPELHIGPNYTAGLPSVDPFWVAGAFALSLAPLTLLRQWNNAAPNWEWLGRFAPRLRFLLPGSLPGRFLITALPVLVLFGLLFVVNIGPEREDEATTDPILLAITALVMLLIIIRQLLTMRDLVDARLATQRAEQLDELKDQFITSVNHELRTPLMAMKSFLTLLTDTNVQATQEKRQEMLSRANRSCENLVYLVQGILDTRRIDQEASNFVPEAINLQATVQAALTLIDPREADPTSRQIMISVPNHLTVWGEALRVQQIITNLISNAIKYSPAGTPIRVQAQELSERGFHLRGGKRSAPPLVEISVQDQGLGIPIEQQALLFRRFVRLPRDIASAVHGTGLGLYLCRVFAEAMGGSISVESTGIPGEGSTFHVRLPVPPHPIPEASFIHSDSRAGTATAQISTDRVK